MLKRQEKVYDFEVVLESNGSGYTVTVPLLPGLVTEGANLKEARAMARDAILCHLEGILKNIVSIPRRPVRERVSRFA
ncbi:MAG: type II toxin-antitoxin system HicB family antitoxin [Candidatus Liptonbacteria bacterium]|nr:type II toxin-antitoxin system HicB family antitoxin [Candidatus Liptonbacteria bacterium]